MCGYAPLNTMHRLLLFAMATRAAELIMRNTTLQTAPPPPIPGLWDVTIDENALVLSAGATCTAGSYASATMSTCAPCPPGTVSGAGATACGLCQYGYYSTGSGRTACTACATGYYSSANGLTQCTGCAPGTFSTRVQWYPMEMYTVEMRANDIPFCANSYYTFSYMEWTGWPIFTCVKGDSMVTQYSAMGKWYYTYATCYSCQQGYQGDLSIDNILSRTTSVSWCESCPIGTYSTAVAATAASTCQSCIAGSYSPNRAMFACVGCATGSYSTAIGATSQQCIQCALGEVSTVGSSACSQCPVGAYSSILGASACTLCLPGTFSIRPGTCYSCPLGSGSFAGAKECVSCVDVSSNQCRQASNNLICPTCSGTCTTCKPGFYGGGKTKCQACPAGTFAASPGLKSITSCSQCPLGTATWQSDSGMIACQDCSAVGRPLPTASHPLAQGQTCPWECDRGNTFIAANDAGLTYAQLSATYSAQGFNLDNASLFSLYHRDHDFCCNGANVQAGQKLFGCGPSSNGNVVACAAVANSVFIMTNEISKLDRCNDWTCNFGYFRSGMSCRQQPRCPPSQTWLRDADGAYIASATNGSFSCGPCSTCLAGSESMSVCNTTTDVICRLCKPTSFSIAGSACVTVVPLGFTPVRVKYATQPPFQGRASFDGTGAPMVGFPQFLNTFTACSPLTDGSYRYKQTDSNNVNLICTQNDPSQCLPSTLACLTECRPWNGSAGWYGTNGACTRCEFDPTLCDNSQYLDMKSCGPTSPPSCAQCPINPLMNANPFFNPRAISTDSPYVCNFTCVNQYTKSGNLCTNCPPIPSGAAYDTTGCTWHCQQGYVLTADKQGCTPCGTVPTCKTGFYPDYNGTFSQCMVCMPCLLQVPDAFFTSAGQPQGPNTCKFACNPNFWFASNPLGCYACSASPYCIAGYTYFTPCTNISDAGCLPCSDCPLGKGTTTPCSVSSDIVCATCDPSLLPANASWILNCRWTCNAGYMKESPTLCRRCMTQAMCKISEKLAIPANGCGRCDPCPTLTPGTQFIGDGQCTTQFIPDCSSRSYPLHSAPATSSDHTVCPWTCNAGFTLMAADEASRLPAYIANYQLLALPTISDATMTALFHRESDACCNLSTVVAGKRLVGCTQTSSGAAQACPPVLDGTFFVSTTEPAKTDRCADFACTPGYYKSNGTCRLQTICGLSQTHSRDASGALLANPDGSIPCVPCSQCLPGSQVLVPCSQNNDTVCQLCGPAAPFSIPGGQCIAAVPTGSFPVAIPYASEPALFQGKPTVLIDGTSPIQWPQTLFTYSACAPKTPDRRYTPITQPTCTRTASKPCTNFTCATECNPWDGRRGWYLSPTNGSCLQCQFNPTKCQADQFLNMATCGPTNPPSCAQCSGTLPPFAVRWKTPLTPSDRCDIECMAGYSKYNYTCLNCPPIPALAIITKGCDWVCPRGLMLQDNDCVQCPPPSCALGSYIDFVYDWDICPDCLPCNPTTLQPNTVFTSTTSCAYACKDAHYSTLGIDPSTNLLLSPCVPCTSQRACTAGSCPSPCTATADSMCGNFCPTTTSIQTPTPSTTPAPVQFASLLGVAIPTGSALTLTQILQSVATDSKCAVLCTAQLVSVTDPSGNTIPCQNNTCPGLSNNAITQYQQRRLLASAWIINVGLISSIPIPTNQVITISDTVVSTYNAPVSATQVQQLIRNPVSLANFMNSYVPPTTRPQTISTPAPTTTSTSSTTNNTALILGVTFAGVFAVGMCCFGLCVRSRRNAKTRRVPRGRRHAAQQQNRRPRSNSLNSKFAITPSAIHVRIQPYSPATTI